MSNFRATVRFIDLVGPDALAVRKALEEQLRIAGLGRWRVVDITEQRPSRRQINIGAVGHWRTDRALAGKLFLVGAAVWALWFFWILVR